LILNANIHSITFIRRYIYYLNNFPKAGGGGYVMPVRKA
jgi:hypothetical protein